MSHQPSKSNEELIEEFAGKWTGSNNYAMDCSISTMQMRVMKEDILQLLKAKDAETKKANTKGYDAGLADGTGNPLIAIEQMREKAVEEERDRIEAVFIKEVPPHAMNLEDSVWLKRLLNKAFNHSKNI